jgi:hypothetical protein
LVDCCWLYCCTRKEDAIDKQFQDQVRGMLKPGTSALFLMVEKVTPDKAVEAMSKYGGTVLKTSLSKEGEKDLHSAGRACPSRVSAAPRPAARLPGPTGRQRSSCRPLTYS